jgi:hypothetical protein
LPKHGVLKQKPTGHAPLPARRLDVCKANFIKIAALYERIADGKDPDYLAPIFRRRSPRMKQIRRFSAEWPDE